LRVTILGKSPAWQDAGGACSSYLVEDGEQRMLLDCGNGAFAKLRERRDYRSVGAVVVSHLHADHFLDLVPFAYALKYSSRRAASDDPPELHAPHGAGAVFRQVTSAWRDDTLIESAFALSEYALDQELVLGGLRVRFAAMPHYRGGSNAVEIEAAGGARFTFGADCAPNEVLPVFARGTDLLLLEATLREPEPEEPRGHLTPAEAGALATRAGARRLVLTHVSDELDAEWVRDEAARTFAGPLEVAREGAEYEL